MRWKSPFFKNAFGGICFGSLFAIRIVDKQIQVNPSFFTNASQAPTAGFQLSDLRVRIVVCVEFLHFFFLESSTENLRLNVKFHRQKVWFLGGFLKAQISDGGFRYSYRLYIIVYYIGSTPHPVTVTTRIFPFLVGNPYKASFVTGILGGG